MMRRLVWPLIALPPSTNPVGLSDDVRMGYSDIRVTYTVDCDADGETVDELCEYVQRTSPVMDILRNPVNVEVHRV